MIGSEGQQNDAAGSLLYFKLGKLVPRERHSPQAKHSFPSSPINPGLQRQSVAIVLPFGADAFPGQSMQKAEEFAAIVPE
jgi:hypothetical protein